MNLVLASTSRYRRELLERLNLPFRALAPQVDEDQFKNDGLEPSTIASLLAVAKAESLITLAPEAAIIGSDQVVDFNGELLGKPGTVRDAMDQLSRLSGRQHRLITAVAVWHDHRTRLHIDVTTLQMRSLTSSAIERYVAADLPVDCAGSYKIESLGISLFESIEASDQTAITGLPLLRLVSMLNECGMEVP